MDHATAARAAEAALPPAFLERLRQIIPAGDLEAVLASFAEPREVGFRVNTLRTEDPAGVIRQLEAAGLNPAAVSGLPLAYTVPPAERDALLASSACASGAVYVQDIASQLPAILLAPEPGERVLDLCAAPGSKTGQIAAIMRNEGEIAAVEVVRGRFFKLRANLADQGASGVRTFNRDGTTVWRHRPEYFDRVLVDAPCSTEGRFRVDDPDTYRFWQPRKPKEMARKQSRLLWSAVQCLRPGGTLVYSTCTFAPEENEAVVSRILQRFEGALEAEAPRMLDIVTLQAPLASWLRDTFSAGVSATTRLLPSPINEAFYVAILRKTKSTVL
jgi:16S rRNA C967 or C1407 C5-methylase (RsmB/RsmF family)